MNIEFIDRVMNFILKGETSILEILRKQYKNSRIFRIDKSEVGAFVEFEITNNSPKIALDKAYIGDVYLELKNQSFDIGVILFVEEGIISMLEFYTYGDDLLPETFEEYKLVYEEGIRNYDTYIK